MVVKNPQYQAASSCVLATTLQTCMYSEFYLSPSHSAFTCRSKNSLRERRGRWRIYNQFPWSKNHHKQTRYVRTGKQNRRFRYLQVKCLLETVRNSSNSWNCFALFLDPKDICWIVWAVQLCHFLGKGKISYSKRNGNTFLLAWKRDKDS